MPFQFFDRGANPQDIGGEPKRSECHGCGGATECGPAHPYAVRFGMSWDNAGPWEVALYCDWCAGLAVSNTGNGETLACVDLRVCVDCSIVAGERVECSSLTHPMRAVLEVQYRKYIAYEVPSEHIHATEDAAHDAREMVSVGPTTPTERAS